MKKKSIERALMEIKKLLHESESNLENAACGYDEGCYSGETIAYENVIELLEKAMQE